MEPTGWRVGGAAVPLLAWAPTPAAATGTASPSGDNFRGDPVAKGVAEEGLFREEGNG